MSPQAALAANLRRLRIARRVSLSELARTTAISKATLSGIEHERGNPTVDTLAGLATALGVPIAELLQAPSTGAIEIVRASPWPAQSRDRLERRRLEALRLSGEVLLCELRLPAHHVHELDARAAGARTSVLVLEGKLIAGPVERIGELSVGDYASFPADVPHLFETTHKPARALTVTA